MARKRRNKNTDRKDKEDDEDLHYKSKKDPDPTSEDYFNDEIEKLHLKKEKILLDDIVPSDEENIDEYLDEDDEVMQLDGDDSDDDDDVDDDDEVGDDADRGEAEFGSQNDNESLDDDDDDTSDEESGLPSSKAWGRKKNQFYSTNVKDIDRYAVDEEEELAAEEEEKEALSLQQRMMSELNAEDFDDFDSEVKVSEENKDEIEIEEDDSHMTKDLSKLSKEEKLQILLKESPELFELLDDYQEKLSEVVEKYHPMLQLAKSSKEISTEGAHFVSTMHQLLLNYCVNINFYLALKASKESVKDHPVIERLVEFRNLISRLEPVAKKLDHEMKELLEKKRENEALQDHDKKEPSDNKDSQIASRQGKSLKNVISKKKKREQTESISLKRKAAKSATSAVDPLEYYNKIASEITAKKMKKRSQFESENLEIDGDDDADEDDDNAKRAITYEMAKNKGLTRKRKKELKNPRVKHKMKFKKAAVKRKSQIPQMRKEAGNYGGELSGIKANVAKSVKIR